MLTKNNNIKIKCEIDGKINLYYRFIEYAFKTILLIKKN